MPDETWGVHVPSSFLWNAALIALASRSTGRPFDLDVVYAIAEVIAVMTLRGAPAPTCA